MRKFILIGLLLSGLKGHAGPVEEFFADYDAEVPMTCRYDSECGRGRVCEAYFPPISLGETETKEFLGHCEMSESGEKGK